MKENPQIYDALASSLAPGVFGHVDIKKAVLLMLLGGVHKQTAEVSVRCRASTCLFAAICNILPGRHLHP